MNKAKKLVVYARTSMSDQNADTQLVALRDYCDRVGYEIEAEYVDNGFSGKDTNRPQFERLLTDIRTKKVECVMVYKLDRIGRSLKHLLNLFILFFFIFLHQYINPRKQKTPMSQNGFPVVNTNTKQKNAPHQGINSSPTPSVLPSCSIR